jgi:hypothetical protein
MNPPPPLSSSFLLSEGLLEALLSPNDGVRLAAEAQLMEYSRTDRIQGFVTFLFQPFQQQQQHYLQFVAVLLRREILQLSPQEADGVLTPFLVPALWQLFQESSGRVQLALGFCLAECCAHAKDHGISRQILVFSFSHHVSPIPLTALLSLWTAMVERAPSNVVSLEDVHRLCEHCVRHNAASSSEWIVPFLEFLVLLATKLEDVSLVPRLGQQYLSPLLRKLRSLLSLQKQSMYRASASWAWTLQTAALEVPDLLQSNWMDVLDLCQYHFSDTGLRLGNFENYLPVASLVASIFQIPYVKRVTMGSTDSEALSLQPVLLIALHNCWRMLFPALYSFTALEPASLQDSTEDDDEDIAHIKETLMDLHRAWPPCAMTYLVPLIQEPLPNAHSELVSLHAWQSLVEAIPMALGASGFIHATQVTLAALHSTASPVQYQVVRLLGCLCECPVAETDEAAVAPFYPNILEALTLALHNKETAIVALACRAMVSYIRPPESSLKSRPILPYLADVIQALVAGPLQAVSDDTATASAYVVQIRAVETLGALAACLSEQSAEVLRPYYGLVMPGLLSFAAVLWQPNVHEYALLRAGASVEAATLWGQAAPDAFATDAERLLPGMVAALEQSSHRMEPILERLWAACARIASLLPNNVYAPYLGRVLPHLLRRVTDPADVEFKVRHCDVQRWCFEVLLSF